MIYWCSTCKVPVFINTKCPSCNSKCINVSSSTVFNPVFVQEKKLLSYIWNRDVTEYNIWYMGNGRYWLNEKSEALPFISFYKSKEHLKIADKLRKELDLSSELINLELYTKANKIYIEKKIYEAENYISEVSEQYKKDYIPTISFSGGKDSTVISRLVRDSLQDNSIIHFLGDTTLEFPYTYEYVRDGFRQENRITPLIETKPKNDFFKLCNVLGPPSRIERWCCTIFKTSNLNSLLQGLPGGRGSLTFLGIRRSESSKRSKYKRTQFDSKISSQINSMPIIDWTDYDVWLYILYKNLLFNDAYKLGYKRVGCWCCPNNSSWSEMLTDIYLPDFAKKWRGVLTDFSIKTNKNDMVDYIENEKWKARKGASGLEAKNINITDMPCNLSSKARNIVVKKPIKENFLELLKPFGKIEILEKEGISYITIRDIEHNSKVCDMLISFGSTIIKIIPSKGTDSLLLLNRIKCQIRKYEFCIKCTACDSVCPYGAISSIGSDYSIDTEKCTSCKKCIAKFYNGCLMCEVLAGKKSIVEEESAVGLEE